MASNIGITENVRLETRILAYQPKQKRHVTVAKEKLQA